MGKYDYKKKDKQYGLSFFERLTVCKIRREDDLTCRNCVYIDSCKINEHNVIQRLNDTLRGYPPRNPEKGIYI